MHCTYIIKEDLKKIVTFVTLGPAPPPLYTYIMLCSPFLTAFISIVLSMNEDDSLKTLLTRALK